MEYIKNCDYCKKEFITKNGFTKFCSSQCYGRAYSKKYYKENSNAFLRLRFEVFKRDNFTCQYCGRNVKEDKVKLEVDHINPKTKGGKETFDNLITSCRECNQGKGDVLLENKKPILK